MNMAESNIPQKTGKELAAGLGISTIKFDGGQSNPTQDYLAEKTLNIKRTFLRLPMEERKKILEEQANDPEIWAFYQQLVEKHILSKACWCKPKVIDVLANGGEVGSNIELQYQRLRRDRMMRVKVAELIKRACEKYDTASNQKLLVKVHAEEVINLIKSELDKLTVIDYTEEQAEEEGFNRLHAITYALGRRDGNKSQLQHTKKQLLDLMGE